MEHENLNLKEVVESAAVGIIAIISVDGLSLTDELFHTPITVAGNVLNVVSDPTSGTFHHANHR